jgi:hypothetical protein
MPLTNSQCSGPFVYERDDFVQRDTTRAVYELVFKSTTWDDFAGRFDEVAFDDENREFLKANVAGVKTVESADDIDDALARSVRLPAIFTLYDGGRSAGREAAQNVGQRVEPRLSVLIVAESLRSKTDGRLGALAIMRATKNAVIR